MTRHSYWVETINDWGAVQAMRLLHASGASTGNRDPADFAASNRSAKSDALTFCALSSDSA